MDTQHSHTPQTTAHQITTTAHVSRVHWTNPSPLDGIAPISVRQGMSLAQQMGELRGNVQINGVAENRMQATEGLIMANAKGKITGRLNVKGVMEPKPLLRWPNENLPIDENGTHPSYDQMTLAQFVQGFMGTVLDLNLPVYKQAA